MNKFIIEFARIYTYFPMVFLPSMVYQITDKVICSSIALLIWTCFNYYVIQSNVIVKHLKMVTLFVFAFSLVAWRVYHLNGITMGFTFFNAIFFEIIRRNCKSSSRKKGIVENLLGMLVPGILVFDSGVILVFMLLIFIVAGRYVVYIVLRKNQLIILKEKKQGT